MWSEEGGAIMLEVPACPLANSATHEDVASAPSQATDGPYAIRVRNVSKWYPIFERPQDRLKQMVIPRLRRLAGAPTRRYYRDFAALRDVSFDVRRGETVGIIGRNGSGKSTLLQVICGILEPTTGAVEIGGRIAALLELGAGFNPEFTGRENVYLNASILGISRDETSRRFEDIAAFADIGVFIDQPVKTYSSGMYVRLAFATAIHVDPDILVVDEALAVGDEAFQRKCFARIEQIQSRGGTILFVSHSPQSVVQLCSRAILFDRGEMIFDGSPKVVVGQYQRLAYASEHISEEVRTSIIDLMQERRCGAEVPQYEVGAKAVALESDPDRVELSAVLTDYFDPDLVNKNRVDFDVVGARVTALRLVDSRGNEVNVLQTGRQYTVEYEVLFDEDAVDVGFGIGFRATNGFSFGGANLENLRPQRLKRCAKGTSAIASFEFKSVFLPGTYFINLAVIGVRAGERAYLARSVDALMFRVAAQELTTAGGFIDFGIQLSVRG